MKYRTDGMHRTGRILLVFLMGWMVGMPLDVSIAGKKDATSTPIPLVSMALEDATVTVTVLEDPLRPVNTLLDLCGSIEGHRQDQDAGELAEHIRRVCQTIEQVTRAMEPPAHALRPDGYLVTIPLREPVDGIRAVTWRSTTLDEAIVFLDLLSGEKLRGVTVSRATPSSSNQAGTCSECPIKDLVFSAASIKEDPRILK